MLSIGQIADRMGKEDGWVRQRVEGLNIAGLLRPAKINPRLWPDSVIDMLDNLAPYERVAKIGKRRCGSCGILIWESIQEADELLVAFERDFQLYHQDMGGTCPVCYGKVWHGQKN